MKPSFEKITKYIEYKIQEKENVESYKGLMRKSEKGLLMSFTFPSSLYFSDIGCRNFKITFFIRKNFFDKYFHEDNLFLEENYDQSVVDYFYTEKDIPICFAVHTNLICIAYGNATGFQKQLFIESYLMFLLYQTSLLKQNDDHICNCRSCNHPMINEKVLSIKNWIDRHLNTSINLHEMCAKFGLQSDTLNIYFEKIVGKNIYDYIWQKKMLLAQELLLSSFKSFKNIAAETGYTCEKQFRIAYKNYFGVAPQLVWAN